MRVGLVVVAAGSGKRFGGPKQFALLDDKPILAHCLEAFDEFDSIADRVVVLPPDLRDTEEWRRIRAGLRYPVRVVLGGDERADSVREGLEGIMPFCDVVAVHDGARPFVPLGAFSEAVALMEKDPRLAAAIVCSPVTDTLKALNSDHLTIAETIDRSRMARAETPQVCRRELLLKALDLPGAYRFTDEGQALEALGLRTAAVMHDSYNVKITTPADLNAADSWMRSRREGEQS
ncbi:2-C-methyl-D-erythritol 4-phosphate cytidylyltransferase [bacterium]|nr:2-C-methyl-D-erythritol 4-phosphate cytidylyltransferase [bacterium]